MKTCSHCGIEKPSKEFYKGRRYLCVDCERETARVRMSSLKNKARNACRNAKKAAKEYGVYDDLTDDDVIYLFKLAKGRCAYTGKEVPLNRLSLEHVIPMSKGGPNTIGNILVVDLSANKSKHDASVMEFIESRYDPHTVPELVKLLAARGNRDYMELYDELYEYQRRESNEQYRRVIEALEKRKKAAM